MRFELCKRPTVNPPFAASCTDECSADQADLRGCNECKCRNCSRARQRNFGSATNFPRPAVRSRRNRSNPNHPFAANRTCAVAASAHAEKLTCDASLIWQCSTFHRSSCSYKPVLADVKLTSSGGWFQQTKRGSKLLFVWFAFGPVNGQKAPGRNTFGIRVAGIEGSRIQSQDHRTLG